MTGFNFTTDGKIKLPSKAEYALADEEVAILAYTHGVAADGRPWYAYVAVRPSRFREFYASTTQKKSMVLGEDGTVIAGEFKAEPSPDVAQKMRELGFDEHYAQKLEQEARKELKAFFERQEVERLDGIVNMLKEEILSQEFGYCF